MLEIPIAKAFLTLLRSGLWGNEIDDLSPFPLSPTAWEQVYKLGVHHTVEGILFMGLEKLPKVFEPPQELFIRWNVRVVKIGQRNQSMNCVLAELYGIFEGVGLPPVLLKGQGLARYYRLPEYRSAGDIDFYFPTKKAYQKANRLMAEKGCKIIFTPGRSTVYYFKKIEIEHHQNSLDVHNPFARPYLKELLEQESEQYDEFLLHEISIRVLSPLLQSVQANVHILKHLLSFGIGIRQFCDVAMIYQHFNSSLDGNRLQEVYRRLHLNRWIAELHGLLVEYLGLPCEMLPFPTTWTGFNKVMMKDVWQAGNFGLSDPRYTEGKNAVQTGKRLWERFIKYKPYAPKEALFFPLFQFYTKITK